MTRALIEMERKQKQKEKEELERRFKKAAMRMKNRMIAMAFATWLEEHDKIAMLKRIMKRMVGCLCLFAHRVLTLSAVDPELDSAWFCT
jgi:hypothetical protein